MKLFADSSHGCLHGWSSAWRAPLLAAAACASLAWGQASAQVYPSRAVTVVVPYAAGGATDLVARIVTRALAKDTGQPFVVDNVVGAGATLGAARVAGAAPDGYTLLLAGSSALVMAPHLFSKLKYDSLTSFAPIGKVAASAYVLMVRADAGITSYEQLVARAQADPAKYSYGSPGVGSGLHLTIELMLEASRFKALHVPFSGIAPAWNALLAGTVDFLIDSPSGALPQLRAGKAIALAVTSPQRVAELPDVPTLQEKGLRGFESMAWFAVLAPKGTPDAVVLRLRQALQAVRKDPEAVAALKSAGFTAPDEDPATLAEVIRREHARWGATIAAHHIQLDK